jgi:hypothetical protein
MLFIVENPYEPLSERWTSAECDATARTCVTGHGVFVL